jgi:DNA-binding LacI/PurR family transcriptional regulator
MAVVEHLVARGHRRIAYLGWPEGVNVGDRRAEGWRRGLEKHGLPADLDLRGDDGLANGIRLGTLLLDREPRPTAIVAATDTLAVGVVMAMQSRGLTPGVDCAVVGFDDSPTARVLDLSSVRQPIEAVGHATVRALLASLGGDNPPVGQLLTPTLVVRASSAGPGE